MRFPSFLILELYLKCLAEDVSFSQVETYFISFKVLLHVRVRSSQGFDVVASALKGRLCFSGFENFPGNQSVDSRRNFSNSVPDKNRYLVKSKLCDLFFFFFLLRFFSVLGKKKMTSNSIPKCSSLFLFQSFNKNESREKKM